MGNKEAPSEVMITSAWPTFTHSPGSFLVAISVVDPRTTVRLEGLGELKIPVTS
jgi:hypothetical protein